MNNSNEPQGTTSDPARRAAAEIVRGDVGCTNCDCPDLCAEVNSKREVEDCIINNIAAIIARHWRVQEAELLAKMPTVKEAAPCRE